MIRIAGIVLLVVFGTLAFAALVALFVPVRYKVCARGGEAGGESAVMLKASWFLGFVRVVYEGGKARVYVFWIKQLRAKKKQKPKVKKEKRKKDEKRQKPVNVWTTVKKILAYTEKRTLVKQTGKLIKRLARAVRPKEFSLKLKIGLERPDQTGYLLALVWIVKGLSGLNIDASGNFEDRVFAFDLRVKGALRMFSLFWPFVAYCIKNPIRALILDALKRRTKKNTETDKI